MELYISSKARNCGMSPTLAIDAKFKQMKADGIDVVGFGTGEPDFDTPQHIKEAAIDAMNRGMTKYTPAAGILPLREAICRKLKKDNGLDYKPGDIVVSNGAKHSLVNAFMAICDPGDEVIIPSPYWVSYPEMVKLADGVPVILKPTSGFKITAEEFESAITDKTRAFVLNSPSNPTGMVYTRQELEAIAAVAVEHEIYVISDEVYESLVYEGEHISIASFNSKIKELTIVINAASKCYAMTGWRMGYSACAAPIAKAMTNIQSHATSNPNSIAQYALMAALDGSQECVEEMRIEFEKRRNYIVERINAVDGVSCENPQGAFYVMMSIKNIMGKILYGVEITDADTFANLLLEREKVALVAGTGFGAPEYLRWSYATSLENIKKGVDRLEEFLKNG